MAFPDLHSICQYVYQCNHYNRIRHTCTMHTAHIPSLLIAANCNPACYINTGWLGIHAASQAADNRCQELLAHIISADHQHLTSGPLPIPTVSKGVTWDAWLSRASRNVPPARYSCTAQHSTTRQCKMQTWPQSTQRARVGK